MRPEKLYAVSRSKRRPTLWVPRMMPRPSRKSRSPKQRPARSLARRAWAITTVTVPIFVSVLALAISVLSYEVQHGSYTSALRSSERAEADLVSVSAPFDSSKAVVQNLGHTAIYGMKLIVLVFPDFHGVGLVLSAKPVYIVTRDFNVQPCSTITFRFGGATNSSLRKLAKIKGRVVDLKISAVSFTDANGLGWIKTITGSLQRIRNGFPDLNVPFGVVNSEASSNGCS